MVSTFTSIAKNTITPTNITKGLSGQVTASPGQYYGFGCFTYSGGQITTPGTLPTFTNINKS